MAEITGSTGGGMGGGSMDICSVSPSDQIGTINNILNRLQNVEAALSALLGTNVEASQLSDISNDLGWIYNVTFLGEEGWTQTPSGTLIPPTGWTGLSDIIDGQSGLTVYGSGFSNVLSVRTTYTTDIATATTKYIHPDTAAVYLINKGDTGLYEGAVGGSKNGWISDLTANFLVWLYVDLIEGTSAPTTGQVDVSILRTRVSSNVNTYLSYVTKDWVTGRTSGGPSGGVGVNVIDFGILSRANTEGWTFRIDNNTDGDVQVAEIIATMVKI